jgi:uncharacterized membrane protein YqaE (UPF0057 family)
MKIARFLLSLLLPPLAVFLTQGIGLGFLINLGLTFLGWVPGAIHAFWVVAKHYEAIEQREAMLNQQ